VDEGRFHVGTLSARFDTRTDPEDPWSGWLLTGDLEHGRGTLTSVAPASGLPSPPSGRSTDYTRAFFDLRRYNRLGPNSQLNMRVVLAGDVNGDQLPLERRLSVDGPGVLPGFDFRSPRTGVDVGTCNAGLSAPGRPAECDRIALAQVEYRGDLNLHFTGDWQDWPRRFHSKHGDVVWVLFADAGRGWKTGPTDDMLTYDRGIIPPLSTFRTDVGVGLDFAGIGIYAAKSTSTPAEPVNFFVRLRHRF
jgi:outer membrane protein assembly factor BamA